MLNIPKPGKSKQQLLDKLNQLKSDFSSRITENNISIENITDGFKIYAEKKVLFLNFYVNAQIIAEDGAYKITWESNAPESKVNEALDKIKAELEKD